MGIDIYAAWKRQAEGEKKKQITGFSTTSGNVGYLREAYHGGPYVTKYLLKEAFDAKGEAAIPAKVLRERLPATVLLSMFREHKVYGGPKDPSILEIEALEGKDGKPPEFLTGLFETMKDESHKEIAEQLNAASIAHAKTLIEGGILPDYAQSFVDFVVLCEEKEKENGEPCMIRASY